MFRSIHAYILYLLSGYVSPQETTINPTISSPKPHQSQHLPSLHTYNQHTPDPCTPPPTPPPPPPTNSGCLKTANHSQPETRAHPPSRFTLPDTLALPCTPSRSPFIPSSTRRTRCIAILKRGGRVCKWNERDRLPWSPFRSCPITCEVVQHLILG